MIGGFIITGSDPKKVIIRAIGPSLTASGISGALDDPTLELHDGSGSLIFANDDWKDTQKQAILDTTIPPTNDLESAIVATLAPGAYTAIVRGKNNGTGVAVVEAYDLNQAAGSKLANISTRGFVNTDNNVMIGGLIVGPTGTAGSTLLVRALGPSLRAACSLFPSPCRPERTSTNNYWPRTRGIPALKSWRQLAGMAGVRGSRPPTP